MLKKISYLALAITLTCTLPSCSDKSGGEPEKNENIDPYTDLSEPELANCYIVQSAGLYKFIADNQFNLGEGLPVPPEIHPASAILLWQTEQSSISEVELETIDGKPYIKFEVNKPSGNALICALDKEGKIEWSWHIWMPADEIISIPTSTGYEVMNMNLGATSSAPGDAASYGMLYQWGRKDPFPAAATLTGDTSTTGATLYDINNNPIEITHSAWTDTEHNSVEYAIAHPTEVLSNYAQYSISRDWIRNSESDDSLWGNPEGDYRDSETNTYPNKGRKTCYDPSPAGWMVPPMDVFRDFTSSGGYAWDFADFNVADINQDGKIDLGDYNYGWHFVVNGKNAIYFPAATRYDGSYGMLMGSMSGYWGNYWSNSPASTISGGAYSCLSFQTKSQTGAEMITISPAGAGSRADAYSVRCIRKIN